MIRRLLKVFATRRGAIGLAAVVIVVVVVAPNVWAWSRLRAGRAALARHNPAAARRELAACARLWGGRAPVRLAACRAAWQDGDVEGARRELRAAQSNLGQATDETAFEWALVQAASGNMREVEVYLQNRAAEAPGAAGPLVWEALAMGYLRVYRILDAMACLEAWLQRSPDNVRALELRGETYVIGRGAVRGAEDFRRVLDLDPGRDYARRRLADAVISLGGYEEAARNLEVLRARHPDDPGLVARLARCYNFLGRRDEARRLLDETLERHPDDGPCLRTRGQLAMTEDRKADAEQWLRRAAVAMPEDYQAQWLLFEALRQQGKSEEARVQGLKADEIKDRVARLTELQSRQLAEFPLDPALHFEMGQLLIQTGRGDVGERWLLGALKLDPEHRASHLALAAYYESRGERARAEEHRARAAAGKE
ncbi:tetratricopeptide repeat protein [Gemmata sp. SH-PL17]|uniref:tetratricopeptide repeat protein n=1 Tax=Gemmata sp. SH-PL17 TaxID=1630693 RepID=UPI0004B44463|nr:tetratricopeptide repeat protein [Gemmata sp. SH-PL17]AMV25652.1 tetratricopeptide repeat protein [Gemmata sp. SH-PL17]